MIDDWRNGGVFRFEILQDYRLDHSMGRLHNETLDTLELKWIEKFQSHIDGYNNYSEWERLKRNVCGARSIEEDIERDVMESILPNLTFPRSMV